MNGEEGQGSYTTINERGSGKVENPQVAPREVGDDELLTNLAGNIEKCDYPYQLNQVAGIIETLKSKPALIEQVKTVQGKIIEHLSQYNHQIPWSVIDMSHRDAGEAIKQALGGDYPNIISVLRENYEDKKKEEERIREERIKAIADAAEEAKQTVRSAHEQARVESQAALEPAPKVTPVAPQFETPKAEPVADKIDPATNDANKATLRYSVGSEFFDSLPHEKQDELASMGTKEAISAMKIEFAPVYVETYIATTFGTEVWNQLPPEKQKELIDKYKDGGESAVFIDLQPIAAEILAPDITKLRKDFQQAQAKTQEENDRINTAADEKLKKTREREDAKLTERQDVLTKKLIELNSELEELKAIREQEIKDSEAALIKLSEEQRRAREARLAEQTATINALNEEAAKIIEEYNQKIAELDARKAALNNDEDKKVNLTP